MAKSKLQEYNEAETNEEGLIPHKSYTPFQALQCQ